MQEEVKRELENMGSFLDKEKYQKEFQIPEAYFAKMQDEVLSKVTDEKKKRTSNLRLRMLVYASAAIIILLLGIMVIFRNYTTPENGLVYIDSEMIYTYLTDNLDDITMQQLILQDIDFEAIVVDENLDEVQNYLQENLEYLDLEELEEIL